MKRIGTTSTGLAFTLAVLLWVPSVSALDVQKQASMPVVILTATLAGPRQMEDTTQNSIVRDYGKAWQSLANAIEAKRPDLLEAAFVGIALNDLTDSIRQQQRSGLRTRYIDRGHKLEAVFYSQEGSAIQLRDTASLEIQYLDGDTVIHSEQVTLHYLTLMTPTADHWQVRLLQAVSAF